MRRSLERMVKVILGGRNGKKFFTKMNGGKLLACKFIFLMILAPCLNNTKIHNLHWILTNFVTKNKFTVLCFCLLKKTIVWGGGGGGQLLTPWLYFCEQRTLIVLSAWRLQFLVVCLEQFCLTIYPCSIYLYLKFSTLLTVITRHGYTLQLGLLDTSYVHQLSISMHYFLIPLMAF